MRAARFGEAWRNRHPCESLQHQIRYVLHARSVHCGSQRRCGDEDNSAGLFIITNYARNQSKLLTPRVSTVFTRSSTQVRSGRHTPPKALRMRHAVSDFESGLQSILISDRRHQCKDSDQLCVALPGNRRNGSGSKRMHLRLIFHTCSQSQAKKAFIPYAVDAAATAIHECTANHWIGGEQQTPNKRAYSSRAYKSALHATHMDHADRSYGNVATAEKQKDK